jgi:hypothetical protein
MTTILKAEEYGDRRPLRCSLDESSAFSSMGDGTKRFTKKSVGEGELADAMHPRPLGRHRNEVVQGLVLLR